MRAVRAATVAVVLSLLGLLVWDVAHSHGGKVARQVDQGKIVAAPAFTMSQVEGTGKVSLASLRGKVVVLNFWASDCVPCKQEQRMLNRAAREWAGKGVVFLGIDEVDLRGPAKSYLRRYAVKYPSVYDGTGTLAGKFGVTGTPETFFIDRRGRVIPPHIIANTERADLDAGIMRALKA
jgi:cytochrome c biogenesis protein CcmG, thiol:disulfide interchange protein DsbE